MSKMPLTELSTVEGVQCESSIPPSLAVTGITTESAKVQVGMLFAALKGERHDGAAFISKAKEKGAAAALCSADSQVPSMKGFPLLRAGNPRRALALMAAKFHGLQPAHIAAVTGTDGKTSTADFFRQLCVMAGKKAASIGTLGVLGHAGETITPGRHTTPDPVALHATLADLKRAGVEHVAMEASSHGLAQYRLDGVVLQAAAFTNLTRDHLDYHVTEEAYFAAKRRLFAELLPAGGTAVLNADDPRFSELQALCAARGVRVLDFGKSASRLMLKETTPLSTGQRVSLALDGAPHRFETPLYGDFQVMNMLAALGLFTGCGGSLAEALPLLPRLKGVPGRLEKVAESATGAPIFIDYAHTAAALAKVLRTLRVHARGRLLVVFGCGGDRDRGKRPDMGRAAAELADWAGVTDDNPRSEDPAAIRREILAACPNAVEFADRREAIHAAVGQLQAGDILAITGKGHEKTQIIGGGTLPFDDAEVAREAAGARKARHG